MLDRRVGRVALDLGLVVVVTGALELPTFWARDGRVGVVAFAFSRYRRRVTASPGSLTSVLHIDLSREAVRPCWVGSTRSAELLTTIEACP